MANLCLAGQGRQKESSNRVLSLSMSEFWVLAITLPSKSIHQPFVLPSYTVHPDTHGQPWQFLHESGRYRLERIAEQSICTFSARSSCISGHFQNLFATRFTNSRIPIRYLWLICAYQASIGKKNLERSTLIIEVRVLSCGNRTTFKISLPAAHYDLQITVQHTSSDHPLPTWSIIVQSPHAVHAAAVAFTICPPPACLSIFYVTFLYLWLICVYQPGIGKNNRRIEYFHHICPNFKR